MKKIIYLLTTFLILCGITSCNNFMNGSDLIQEIDDILAEANAPEVEVLISADGRYGTTAPNGKSWYKVNKPYSIIFTASSEYIFNCWEAVNRETNEILEGIVIFEDKTSIETHFTITENYENILIQPKCNVITKYEAEPAFSVSGVSCDSSIKIVFNTPMNRDDLQSFENISICNSLYEYDGSFNSFYNDPVLSADGTVLTIEPKGEIIKELLKDNVVQDIYVYLNSKVRTQEDILLSDFYDEKILVLKSRINNTREMIKPTVDSIKLKDINNNELITKKYSEWANPDFYINHVNNSININVTGTDEDSGIKNVIVNEVLVRNVNGEVVDFPVIDGNDTYGHFARVGNQEKKYECSFQYTLRSQMDGLIQLTFETVDNAGVHSNPSQPVFVIKDTSSDVDTIKIWNTLDNYKKMFWDVGDETFFIDDLGNSYTSERHILKICYGDVETNLSDVEFTQNQNSVVMELPNTSIEYMFRIYIVDSLGNGNDGNVYKTVIIPRAAQKINTFAYYKKEFYMNMPKIKCKYADVSVEYAFYINKYYDSIIYKDSYSHEFWKFSVTGLDAGIHYANASMVYVYKGAIENKIYGPLGDSSKICVFDNTGSGLTSIVEKDVNVSSTIADMNNSTKTVSYILKNGKSFTDNSFWGFSYNNQSWLYHLTAEKEFHFSYGASGQFMYCEYNSTEKKLQYALLVSTTSVEEKEGACTTPPYVENIKHLFAFRNSVSIFPFHASTTNDKTEGFLYEDDKYVPIRYWIIPYNEKWNDAANPISVNDLNNYKSELFYSKDPGLDFTFMPTGNITDGKYIVYASLSNKELNTYTGPVQYINIGTDTDTIIQTTVKNNKLTVNISNFNSNDKYFVNIYKCFDEYNDNTTDSRYRSEGYVKYKHIWDSINRSLNQSATLTSITKEIDDNGNIEISLDNDTFYKFCVMSCDSNGSYTNEKELHKYTDVRYVYNGLDTSYYNLMTEKSSGSIYYIGADVYAYTSTFYSPEMLDNSIEVWQNKGIENNIKVLSKNKNINYPSYEYNVEKQYIPSGYYYTVITVFADGTSQMSPIYRK